MYGNFVYNKAGLHIRRKIHYSITIFGTVAIHLEGKKMKSLSYLKMNFREIKVLNIKNKTAEKKRRIFNILMLKEISLTKLRNFFFYWTGSTT